MCAMDRLHQMVFKLQEPEKYFYVLNIPTRVLTFILTSKMGYLGLKPLCNDPSLFVCRL